MFFRNKHTNNIKSIITEKVTDVSIIKNNAWQSKQYYGSIIANKVVDEVSNALDVTKSLLESVKNINIELEKQDSHIDKTVDVSSSVAAFSEEVIASVDETMKVIEDTIVKAEDGQKSFIEVVSSIHSVYETVENMNEVLMQLSEKSSKIEEIVDAIKNIAKTTHLLSLNANIEAARAGDAGKGFSVVAGEVKKLADSSSTSADKISQIITEINTVTEKTINILNSGIEKVQTSTKTAENAGKVIDDMMCSIEKTKTISVQISDAVKDQADKNQNMIHVIDELVQVSEAVKNLNENVSVNAERQKASLNELKYSTGNLSTLLNSHSDKNSIEKTTFKFNLYELDNYDPHIHDDSNSLNFFSPINLSLVQFGSGSGIIAGLAKNWHVEDDNLTWSFVLRPDIKFHNGRTVTAYDVKYSYERILSKELNSPNDWLLSIIKGADKYKNGSAKEVEGIVVTGNYSLKIVLQSPYSSFINNLASPYCCIIPKEEEATFKTKPIGAGPYKFVQHDKVNKEVTLEKFTDYSLGQALVDNIIIEFKDENIDEFINKNLDYIVVNNKNKELLEQNKYKIHHDESTTLRFLAFNFTSPNPLVQNKLCRQAISYCIDRDRIIKEAFSGLATKANAMIPSCMIDAKGGETFSKNITKAKELLKRSGVNHNSITMQIAKNGPNMILHNKILEILIDNFKDINITIKPIQVDSSIFNNSDTIRNQDTFIFGWSADSGTADNYLEPLTDGSNGSNRAKYNSDEIVSLIDCMKNTSNPYKYKSYLANIEAILEDEVPWINFGNVASSYAVQEGVKGLRIHPLNFIKLADVWKE